MSQPQPAPPAATGSSSSSSSKHAGQPQRDPPPALFMPPSPASSFVSLPSTNAPPPSAQQAAAAAVAAGATTTAAPKPGPHHRGHSRSSSAQITSQPDPLAAALSTLQRPGGMADRGGSTSTATASASAATAAASTSGPSTTRKGSAILPPLQTQAPYAARRRESTRATDRTDALWAEMQATLEEVELSASGGTRVFGPGHDRKLAELRAAQIALAQAWVRSEADGVVEMTTTTTTGAAAAGVAAGATVAVGKAGSVSTERGTTGGGGPELRTDGTEARSAGTAGAGSARPGSSGGGAERLGQKMEAETESDIQFARKRREANDRYFQRINQGVLDVVAKLEDVATAMRAVEQESKDVWGDESVPSSARP